MDDLTNINVIRNLFRLSGFSFSKSLGQNFLINPTVCPKIAELGGADSEHGIIEIGAGVGVLTNELAKRAKKVVAVEIDERLRPILKETLSEYSNVRVIFGDIMKTDLRELIASEFDGLRVSVCANLPYYITSPVIMKLLEERLPVDTITVMVQKEAGRRLCAKLPAREAGAVTAAVSYYSEPEMLFGVSRGSFMPSPKVDSCVVRLRVRSRPPVEVENEELFFRVIRGTFSQRRKTLVNSLAGMGLDKLQASEAVSAVGLSLSARPEQLSLEDFAGLSNELGSILNAQL